MKRFDLEKAKNGAAVCLMDGTPVKILDFDYNGLILYKHVSGDKELLHTVNGDGRAISHCGTHVAEFDLFMQPICGYMAIKTNSENIAYGLRLHSTLEDAKKEVESLTFDKYSRFLAYAKVELLDEEENEQ
ncbi:MAG: hypothetical protein IKR77_04930 [Bacteroidales bacterium]|nr:hypothetical protein [Bacteroidales bacterium]